MFFFSICSNFRVVGGLLSAYDLSGDKIFLEKARDIADRLLPAWDTPTGIPYNRINLAHGHAHNFGWTGVKYENPFFFNPENAESVLFCCYLGSNIYCGY